MAYEQRENSGSVFKNNRKEKDSHPDLTGSCLVNGKEMWISGWRKTDKNGEEWISFSFKEKEPRREEPREEPRQRYEERRNPPPTAQKPVFDDEVPF
jgi:hypothetical protein